MLIVLIFIAFISLGMPDGLLGVAWPGIRQTFGLPVDAMGLLLIFQTSGYMSSSFFSAALTRRLGIGGLLAGSCAATAAALAVYSVTPIWGLFMAAAIFGGLGAGAIDAGLNAYVAEHYGERVMQWLHASFGVGITAGPMIMTLGLSLTGRWQNGYRWVALAQFGLALLFLLTRGAWARRGGARTVEADASAGAASATEAAPVVAGAASAAAEAAESGEPEPGAPATGAARAADSPTAGPAAAASMGETLGHLPSLLSGLLFVLYTGVEIGLGLWIYSLLTEARGVTEEVAGFVTGSYWATFTVGRILAGLAAGRVPARRLIALGLSGALVGVLLILVNLGPGITVVGVAVTGFSVAPIFPGLVSDTGARVGRRHAANTIGMQISAAGLGAVLLPGGAGLLADAFGLEAIPVFLTAMVALLTSAYALAAALGRRRFGELRAAGG